jgi:hypothetical protein
MLASEFLPVPLNRDISLVLFGCQKAKKKMGNNGLFILQKVLFLFWEATYVFFSQQ